MEGSKLYSKASVFRVMIIIVAGMVLCFSLMLRMQLLQYVSPEFDGILLKIINKYNISKSNYWYPVTTPGIDGTYSTESTRDLSLEEEEEEKKHYRIVSSRGKTQGLEKDKIWAQAMTERFRARNTFLQEQCSSFGGDLPKPVTLRLLDRFYYSKKYDLIACISAKGGATTWKFHFLHMAGFLKSDYKVHGRWSEKKIVAKDIMGKKRLISRGLKSPKVTRVISVRHPLARLVSAYTNKFHDGRAVIIEDERRFSFIRDVLRFHHQPSSPGTNSSVSFPQFLNYIVSIQRREGTHELNRHWRPYSTACDPCQVPYDYIMQLETFEEDLRYLVLTLGVEEVDVTVRKNKSTKEETPAYERYFKDLPADLLRKIYLVYQYDFGLFGYEVPQFMTDALSTHAEGDR